jgi:hypothetical protein
MIEEKDHKPGCGFFNSDFEGLGDGTTGLAPKAQSPWPTS